jgi:hypothetical protein
MSKRGSRTNQTGAADHLIINTGIRGNGIITLSDGSFQSVFAGAATVTNSTTKITKFNSDIIVRFFPNKFPHNVFIHLGNGCSFFLSSSGIEIDNFDNLESVSEAIVAAISSGQY